MAIVRHFEMNIKSKWNSDTQMKWMRMHENVDEWIWKWSADSLISNQSHRTRNVNDRDDWGMMRDEDDDDIRLFQYFNHNMLVLNFSMKKWDKKNKSIK